MRIVTRATLGSLVLSFTVLSALAAEERTFDGLVEVEDARVARAFIDPDADFSRYRRVIVFEPNVAFRDNWQRDQNRNTRMRRVSNTDMERIRTEVGALFHEVMVETMEAHEGYEVVDVIGDDVLVIRPSIIELDVNVPNTRNNAPVQTVSAQAGSATLFVELFDSVSGDIIGRAIDRQTVGQNQEVFVLRGGAASRGEARRVFGSWAAKLREFLDSHYSGK